MEKETRRNFLKIVGPMIIFPGCTLKALGDNISKGDYNTHVSQNLKGRSFGDKDFNVEASVTKLNGKEYVWMPLLNRPFRVGGAEYTVEDDQITPDSKYFPLGALDRSKLIELTDPNTGVEVYSYEDDKFMAFKRDDGIKKLSTGIRAIPRKMSGKNVKRVGESYFTVPEINFAISGLERVSYASTTDGLTLSVSPRYGVNHNKGSIVEIYPSNRGGMFVEKEGTFKISPFDENWYKNFSKDTFVKATVKR